jgi:hypothetical protein
MQNKPQHFCRHCRGKLKEPVDNHRNAFCVSGCHRSFYRHRCLACEQPMERKTEGQLICGKRRCRNALRAGLIRSRYHTPSHVISPPEKPDKMGLAKGWFVVASPPEPYTPNQLHCATISDGIDGTWKDSKLQRIEAQNRAALKAAEEAEIEANGYFTDPDWRETVSPDGVRCFVTSFQKPMAQPSKQIDGVPSDWEPCNPSNPILDDLSIPEFLRR